MVKIALIALLGIATLGAVGFEDRREMIDCYLAKPEVYEIGRKA